MFCPLFVFNTCFLLLCFIPRFVSSGSFSITRSIAFIFARVAPAYVPPPSSSSGPLCFFQEFLDPMFYALRTGQQQCQVAAGTCIGKLRDMVGPRILAGRLNDEQVRGC